MLPCLCPVCGEVMQAAVGSAVLQGTSRRLMIRLNRLPIASCPRCPHVACLPDTRRALDGLSGQVGASWELRAAHLGA